MILDSGRIQMVSFSMVFHWSSNQRSVRCILFILLRRSISMYCANKTSDQQHMLKTFIKFSNTLEDCISCFYLKIKISPAFYFKVSIRNIHVCGPLIPLTKNIHVYLQNTYYAVEPLMEQLSVQGLLCMCISDARRWLSKVFVYPIRFSIICML